MKKWKKCHFPQLPPITESKKLKDLYLKQYRILLKEPEQITKIRRACQLAAQILDKTCTMAKIGVSTNALNDYADELTRKANAIPAALHYGQPPFPKSICTSLNEVICHGIPNDLPLQDGDILNIDVAVILDGHYGDCSSMVMLGDVSSERRLVSDVAHECLHRAINILKPGILLHQIGDLIEDYAASQGCSVVDQFVGHGVGVAFHEAPNIPHHRNQLKIPLAPGMTFTIEPMINAGVRDAVVDPKDGWIARTKDGRASAQWEHTLLITDTGYEILTLLKKK